MWLRSKNKYTENEIKTIIVALVDYFNNLMPFYDTETDVEKLISKLCNEIDIEYPKDKLNYF